MLRIKSALLLLILCSFSLFLTSAFDPSLQKSYFSIKPNSSFSYEFYQTSNGTYAHYFDNSTQSSKYILFNLTSGDAYPVLENITAACQVTPSTFQHLHYHVETDTLVYYCAVNASLLIIDQEDQTVQTAIDLNLNQILPAAKLSTDGMNVTILAMDNLFIANPQSSLLITVDMQSQQVVSQLLLNQNLKAGEAVVAYAKGSKKSYIATNLWQYNSFITKIYTIIINDDDTYKIRPLDNLIILNSTTKTVTKLLTISDNIALNVDATLYFLDYYGVIHRQYSIQTKQVARDIFHPAFVRSTDGYALYFHLDTLTLSKYTSISLTNLGTFKDMQIAHANQNSNDLMFTSDASGVFFKILDLQSLKSVYTTLSSYNDLMLTETTYTVVRNNTFYVFNLETDRLIAQVSTTSSKYYYNKNQHIITFLSAPQDSSCQVTHLDLVSGKLWTTLSFSSSDICDSFVLSARVTEKGNSELVISTNQSYLIISETYGQITFNTNYPTDSINVNFDDLSFFYYTANQVLKQINASLYTFNPQSQSFQLNNTKILNLRPVESHGFFPINQNLTVALSDLAFTFINQFDSQLYFAYNNTYNLVTGFEDQYNTQYLFFSYVSANSHYPLHSAPVVYKANGEVVSIPGKRDATVSGQATGPKSFALYEEIYSSVGVVRFFNSDTQNSKTLISI